ncbi:hypothetical protein V1291_003315 [Nitrobacteraceae bacterium AZCC 1564]
MLSASQLLWTRIGAGVCLFMVANQIYALWKVRSRVGAGKSWSRTSGKIITSTLSQPDVPRKGGETDATVDIRYQYQVSGKSFEGKRIKFGGQGGMTRVAAEQLVAKYPIGAAVDVYYDPKSPVRSALEPRNKSSVVSHIVFLAVFSVISIVLIAHSIAGKVLTNSNGMPLFAFLLPLLAIFVGIGAFVQYIMQRKQISASMRWPTVLGKITEVGVVAEERHEDDDDGRTRITTVYRSDVQYAYAVGGREFHSNKWNWGWTAFYPDEASARAPVAEYTVGASVPVFYNPQNPEEAILEPGNKDGRGAQLIFGAMFVIAGAIMLWAFSVLQA